MLKTRLINKPMFSGITVGGSSGGQPLPIFLLTGILLIMTTTTIYTTLFTKTSIDLTKEIPFKCANCGYVEYHTLQEMRKVMEEKMERIRKTTPNQDHDKSDLSKDPIRTDSLLMMGPLKLDCPKCRQQELTPAVECPMCSEIFVLEVKGLEFNDTCPHCGMTYRDAWKHTHMKE